MTADADRPRWHWVSPFHPDACRGGWQNCAWFLLRSLEARLGPAERHAPVLPPPDPVAQWTSRAMKVLRLPRPYWDHSPRRLAAVAADLDRRIPPGDTRPVVYFTTMPWCLHRPRGPAVAFHDGSFSIHVRDYNTDHSFSARDLARLERAEAAFTRRLTALGVTSRWTADRIVADATRLGVDPGRLHVVGIGPGRMPPPDPGPRDWPPHVLMIAADFERKGGRRAVAAIAAARAAGVDARLTVVGAPVPADLLGPAWLISAGWLDPTHPDQGRRFVALLRSAGLHLLCSRSDLTPIAVIEAALHGVATCAPAVGGLPEMIADGRDGLIDPDGTSAEDLGRRLATVLADPARLRAMGEAARTGIGGWWNWTGVASRLAGLLDSTDGRDA